MCSDMKQLSFKQPEIHKQQCFFLCFFENKIDTYDAMSYHHELFLKCMNVTEYIFGLSLRGIFS